jgi:single-stranded-DNA-specific exonuclease
MTKSTLDPSRLCLGVERSALGRAWHNRLDAAGQARALAIAQLHGTGDLLSRVLAGRGIGAETTKDYLDPSLRQLLPDPCALNDMDAAATRIAAAVERAETIAIFGDYDVDGAAASALLADYFRACGVNSIVYIPDRIFEGYGPNVEAVRKLSAAGASILITVDCGTASHVSLAEAQSLGLDAIVLDHHQAGETLPEALVVNPNRQDDLSGQGQLCAAGVTFLTLVATHRILRAHGFFGSGREAPDLLAGLDLVALATIADVAPLTGLNRAFVVKGLKLMQARRRPGLTALLDIAGADGPPRPYHLGFLVGPRINAGGRIGDAALGSRLLSLEDPIEAARIAQELDGLNRERQELEHATLDEAEAQALGCLAQNEDRAGLVVFDEAWHPGVVGLVASRLKDKFRRPAFAIAVDRKTGMGTGSGRSIPGVDLGDFVRKAVAEGTLVKGGGHKMAAGLTIARNRLAEFSAYLEDQLAEKVRTARAGDCLWIDAALTAAGATAELAANLERAGPYGAANPEPIFVLPAHRLIETAEVGRNHIRIKALAGDGAKLEGIAFRAVGETIGRALEAHRGTLVHLAGSLALDHRGRFDRVQLRLLDLAPASTPFSVRG